MRVGCGPSGTGNVRAPIPNAPSLESAPDAETKDPLLNEVTTAPEFAAGPRASLFVFPSTAEPVLASPPTRQVDRMNDAVDQAETSELRATFLLFAVVLLIPALLGFALLGIR